MNKRIIGGSIILSVVAIGLILIHEIIHMVIFWYYDVPSRISICIYSGKEAMMSGFCVVPNYTNTNLTKEEYLQLQLLHALNEIIGYYFGFMFLILVALKIFLTFKS